MLLRLKQEEEGLTAMYFKILLEAPARKLPEYEEWVKALEGKQVYTEDALKLLLTDNTLSGIFGEAIDIVRKKLGKCNS